MQQVAEVEMDVAVGSGVLVDVQEVRSPRRMAPSNTRK